MEKISKPSISRIARRAGVKSISEELIEKFLEIPNFKIYELLYYTAKILNDEELEVVMSAMKNVISEI